MKRSVILDAALANRLQMAASTEGTSHADFTRKLLLWALPHYQAAGSLWVLRQAVVTVPKLMPLRSVKGAKQQTRVSGGAS
jgi:hypothetical protein